MAFWHNQLDLTFPDDIFASAQRHFLPLAPPTTDAETLLPNVEELAGPFEDLLGYNFEASDPESQAPSRWTETLSNSLPVSANGESHGVQSQGRIYFHLGALLHHLQSTYTKIKVKVKVKVKEWVLTSLPLAPTPVSN
ncbi:hypothetical protein BDN70DRAFT_935836 [Pholiota conissans]|uniref:Uncharacterized protein n=1 Tax=Pholiota conissans TaxID=109636 RepID=A0A9P5YUR9_9AGAR|nr:hypothetical protein BDN70DRAFT_935836 [Pholiota conissans]